MAGPYNYEIEVTCVRHDCVDINLTGDIANVNNDPHLLVRGLHRVAETRLQETMTPPQTMPFFDTGAVEIEALFSLPRPNHHFQRRRGPTGHRLVSGQAPPRTSDDLHANLASLVHYTIESLVGVLYADIAQVSHITTTYQWGTEGDNKVETGGLHLRCNWYTRGIPTIAME